VRILTFTGLFPNRTTPNMGIFIFQRVAHLALRPGNHVRVIAPVIYFPRWFRWTHWKSAGQVPSQETIGGLTVLHPRYPILPKISMPLHGLLLFLGTWWLTRRLTKETQFDCIDAHFIYPDCLAAVLLGKFLGLPVIVSARGTDINLYPSFKLIRPMIRWTLLHSAGAIAVSTSLRDVMVELGLSEDRIRVIGNGIDPGRFHRVDPVEARRHLGLPESGQILVSVGGLIPRKGFHFLIPAVAQIASRFPNLRLYILGEGEYRSTLESLIRQCNLQEQVFLVGSVPNTDLRYWFSAAYVSCLLSSREGWPNVLQESLACGTPVVATRVWGAPEVIVSPDLGFLVEQSSPAIATALESALNKDWNREAIARHAGERTWAVVAAEVEDYLASCVRRWKKEAKTREGGGSS
jgi:teichuronic acid biosynthesis glycosyltransferase TuaC